MGDPSTFVTSFSAEVVNVDSSATVPAGLAVTVAEPEETGHDGHDHGGGGGGPGHQLRHALMRNDLSDCIIGKLKQRKGASTSAQASEHAARNSESSSGEPSGGATQQWRG